MVTRLPAFITRHAWAVLVATVVVAAAAGSGLSRLAFSANYRVFFTPDDPQLRAFDELQGEYTPSDNCLFCVAPHDGQVFTRDTLSAVEELTQGALELPHATRIDSLTNFQHTYARGDDLVVEDLLPDPATMSDAELMRRRAIALDEPFLVHRLLNPDASVTGVNVMVALPPDDAKAVEETVAAARALRERVEARHPRVDIYLTGVAVMNNAFAEASARDMRTLVPIMGAVILLILTWLVRSAAGAVGAMLVILLALATAMGLAGWLGIRITPGSNVAPVLICTLGIADSVHLLNTILRHRAAGESQDRAVVEAVRINLQPIFLTSLTTAVGFLCLNFSDVPPFRDLGNIVAIGVVAAWLYSTLSLPAFLALVPLRPKARTIRGRAMHGLAEWVIRHRRALLLTAGPVVLGLAALAPLNELDDQFVQYFGHSMAFRRETDFVVNHLTGIYQLEYSLHAPTGSSVTDPTYLKRIDAFARWWRTQPRVLHVASLSDVMRRLNRNMNGDDVAHDRLPERADLAAQYLLLYEISLPPELDLAPLVTGDKSASHMVVTFRNLTSLQVREAAAAGDRWLHEHAPDLRVLDASTTLMFANLTLRNIRSMLLGTFLALVVISAILIFAFRSWRIGLVSLLPNVAPAAMGFGLWGVFVGRIGMALAVVASMTLGIVVDDTIHFLSRYLRGRRERGLPPEAAVHDAFTTVGSAMGVTSIILVAGFAVLALSDFRVNADMGLLSALVIALALAADYLLLPPLLLALDGGVRR